MSLYDELFKSRYGITRDSMMRKDPREIASKVKQGVYEPELLDDRLPKRELNHDTSEIYHGVQSPPSKIRLIELREQFGETPRPENTRDVEDIEVFDKAVKDAEDKRRND